MPRARALVVRVEDRPGVLGEVATALGEKKVNLRAVHGSNEGGQGILRLVVDKFGVAKRVLAARGWQPQEEEILEIRLSDRPAPSARRRTCSAAAVNITSCVRERRGRAGGDGVPRRLRHEEGAEGASLRLTVPPSRHREVRASLTCRIGPGHPRGPLAVVASRRCRSSRSMSVGSRAPSARARSERCSSLGP